MKTLVKVVKLIFFQDNATGDYGVTHQETYDDNYGEGFNAFWNGIGIFHDVFEHSHEFTHKYFKGEYALNIGGEMTAMGAMWYYYDIIGLHNRQINPNSIYPMCESMKRTTLDEIQETITQGYCRYGNRLESNIPKQSPTDNYELEYQIRDFSKKVKTFEIAKDSEESEDYSKEYKKSVTFRKIADLHRYGYRMANKLIPNNNENRYILSEFIDYWNKFCKQNSAEELNNLFKGITFKIYKEKGIISWKAVIEAKLYSGISDIIITEKTKSTHIEEFIEIEY